MSKHINTINIESFRGIKNLCLENLAPINILTGDNNCGKTSVLEVIESLDDPCSFDTWRTLIRRERLVPLGYGLSYYEGVLNLFNVDEENLNIKYDVKFADGEIEKVEIEGRLEEESLTMKECQELSGIMFDQEDSDDELSTQNVEKLDMLISLNGNKVKEYEFYDIQRRFRFERHGRHLANITYISPVRHAEGTVFLNSVLDNPDLYEQMLQILREFDPGIISINVDNANERYRQGNVYKILSKEHGKALPLNVYGDGMKKAVLLMSAVIKTQGGILLLDEFETAIHTTVMDKMFSWILETCVKLGVQLFLTTHSEEAIDKVLKCNTQLQDKIKVFTLYKNGRESIVRTLDAYKAIEIKDEMGLDLR